MKLSEKETLPSAEEPHLDVRQVVVNAGALGDAVALVEVEGGPEHVFAEPHFGEGVEEPLVVVVGDAAAVLNLSDHVPHRVPRYALGMG